MWRGPALDGVDSAVIRQAADVLEEERLQTAQECLEVELAQGRAGEVVAELTKLVQQYPLREGLHRALMLGLYRAGRQADALTAYRRARQLLHDELGIEPAAELQKLHHAILNRDPSLDPAPVTDAPAAVTADQRPMPRELPAAVAGFTGRGDALAALDRLLGTGSADAGPVVISAIAGTAGVGKTALAVHWAHRVADRFPDGQLYIDLRGYAVQPPLRPIEALEALLRSLGVPPEVLALQNLGVTLHLLGLLEDSREHLESALAMSQELGDRPAEAGTQEALAAIHRDAGRCDKGLELANQAHDLSREIGDQRGEAESLNTLASIQLRLGNPEDALHLYQGALDLAHASGDVGPQADALLGLAGAYHAHGEFGVALENAQLALDLVRVPGYRVQEGLALAQLAETSFEHGRHEDSLGYAQQALESHRTSGHKLGEARARSLLSKVVHANGDLEAAVGHRRAALNLYLTVGAAPVNGVLPVARGGQEPA